MGATALALLKTYRRTALLLAASAAVALWAGLPVALLADRLSLLGSGLEGDGLAWSSPVTRPAELRQVALDGLVSALVGAGAAAVGVAALTLVALAAARMAQREREVAVRRAVGASRRALVGGLALEGLVIATVAIAAGLPPGILLARRWLASWPGTLTPGSLIPALLLVLLLGLLLVVGAVFPLLFARRLEVTEPPDGSLALRIPALLLGGSLAVLATGLVLTRHVHALTAGLAASREPGQVVRVSATGPDAARRALALEAALARAAAVPEADAVGLIQPGALTGLGPVSVVRVDCGPCWPFRFRVERATHFFVAGAAFAPLGVRLLEGRLFTAADRYGAEPVALVNEALARAHFAPPVIGREIMVGNDRDRWYRVVGVVADGPAPGLGATLRPPYSVYLDARQHAPTTLDLVVPGGGVEGTVLTRALEEVPGLRLLSAPSSSQAALAVDHAAVAWLGPLFLLEGWVMLGLALLGTFALVRLWVLSLAGEIGIRRAAGAPARVLFWSVLGRAGLAGLVGLAIGACLGPTFWQALRIWLPGLGGWEAATLFPAAGLLVAAALAAAALPARSLVRTSPAQLFETHAD